VRSATVYRSLLRLYPKDFRTEYDDDLVQYFAELVADRGARAAWARTTTDLMVTVPRYRMESLMTDKASSDTLYLAIGLLAIGGFAGFFVTDIAILGVVLLFAAIALAVTQRSALARSIRTPDTDRRHRRLKTAAFLSPVFPVLWFTFDRWVDDSWSIRETVVTIVGVLALVGGVSFFVAGLLTPRAPKNSAPAHSVTDA
jgi:hypothetical protein